MEEQNYNENTHPETKPRRKTGLATLIAGICLLIIGIAAYFIYLTPGQEAPTDATTDTIAAPAYDRRQSVGNSPDIMKALADSMASARARISAELAADSAAAN